MPLGLHPSVNTMQIPNKRIRRPAGLRRQSGLSLIELMVGITIGLLVVTAAIGSLVFTKVASTTVGDSSRLQQEASTAFRIIGDQIRQGGARRIQAPIVGSSRVVFNADYTGFGVNATTGSMSVISGSDASSAGTDTLQLSRDGEPDLLSTDCLGELPLAASASNLQTQFFRLVNAANVGELRCRGSGATSATAVTGFPIVQNVEDFQVWYGFRTGDDLQYRTATEILATSPAPWSEVESIMVCLRMTGESGNNPGGAVNGCLPNEVIANDGRIRKVFFRVFNIRNAGL